ncbi:MAG: hypothetical protein RJB62_1994 [Pseudomonadota bacterium]
MKRMGFAALGFSVMLLFAGEARAQENWIYAKAIDGAVGYETTTAESFTPGIINGYNFIYMRTPLAQDDLTVSFMVSEADYDCANHLYRTVFSDVYDLSFVKLTQYMLVSDAFMPIEPNSVWDIGHSIFCNQATLTDSQTAPDMFAAFQGGMILAEQTQD